MDLIATIKKQYSQTDLWWALHAPNWAKSIVNLIFGLIVVATFLLTLALIGWILQYISKWIGFREERLILIIAVLILMVKNSELRKKIKKLTQETKRLQNKINN